MVFYYLITIKLTLTVTETLRLGISGQEFIKTFYFGWIGQFTTENVSNGETSFLYGAYKQIWERKF